MTPALGARRFFHKHIQRLGRSTLLLVAAGLATLVVEGAPKSAAAQTTPFAVAAKVDDDIITGYDVDQRARLIALETRAQDRAQIMRRAREELIEETLKEKEARRRGVTIEADAVTAAVDQIARGNGTTSEAFLGRLEQAGVDASAFTRRVRASLAWNQMLRANHLRKIQPSDGEVAAEMEAATATGPAVYDVRQIVVDLAPTAQGAPVRAALKRALDAREQIKTCADIARLAPKYSRISGSVGRITARQMPGPVRQAVLALQTGETTKPLRSQNGWHVIMLCGVTQEGSKPNEDQIRSRLAAKKAENVSRSLVADLRRDALIEIGQ